MRYQFFFRKSDIYENIIKIQSKCILIKLQHKIYKIQRANVFGIVVNQIYNTPNVNNQPMLYEVKTKII